MSTALISPKKGGLHVSAPLGILGLSSGPVNRGCGNYPNPNFDLRSKVPIGCGEKKQTQKETNNMKIKKHVS